MTYPPQTPLQYDPRYASAPAYAQPNPYGGQFAQAPYAPQPSQGGQGVPTAAPALGVTRGAGGNVSPKARHLVGRTILIEPIRVDEAATDPAGKPRPEAYFHLTVIDGGPLRYGDNQDRDVSKQHGPTFEVDTPVRFTNVNDYGYGFVNEVRDAIARGDLCAVGVFEQGTQGNKPYLVTKPGTQLDGKERPDGDQRFAAATDLWNRIFAKDTSWSATPRSLVAPPAQQPAQVAYQPTAPQQGYAAAQQPIAQPYPYGGAAQPLAQQQPDPRHFPAPGGTEQAWQQSQGYAAPQPAMDPGYAAYLAAQQAQQQPAPVPQSAPPVDPQYAAWLASQQAQPGPGF